MRVLDFWLDMGVDGLRLDAVPYLFEREGTNCENLPETHQILKKLRAHIDDRYKGRMLLAEANQWPEDAARYFGQGDECHMAYHFPVMPRLFMSLRMEDRFPIIDIMEQTPAIPDNCQWAIFLRNHDELTLEMVTDEERDFMYRAYARDPKMRINLGIRRRLAPLLGNHRRRIELMNGLLLSLPGSPVLYYGDEIGMGDNVYLGDRDGVRTPMQWDGNRNAGFSSANPQSLYLPVIIDPEYHYQAVNVEAQQNNPSSILWWTRRLIALRKKHKALSLGTIKFLYPENPKILVFVREYENERVLMTANLSRFAQYAEIDLSEYSGMTPIEMFGQNEFPAINDQPYLMTIGPHSFYWFELKSKHLEMESADQLTSLEQVPLISVDRNWWEIVEGGALDKIVSLLPKYLPKQRWFGAKARKIKSTAMVDVIPLPAKNPVGVIGLVRVDFTEGEGIHVVLPLAWATPEDGERRFKRRPWTALVRVRLRKSGEEGLIMDATGDPEFNRKLFGMVSRRSRLAGRGGKLAASMTPAFTRIRGKSSEALEPTPIRAEQSNTSVIYGDRFILKLFRRLESGLNPDLEIGRYLTRQGFTHAPSVAGSIEYVRDKQEPLTLAILHEFVPNQGDAWSYTIDILGHYFEHALARLDELPKLSVMDGSRICSFDQTPSENDVAFIGPYLETAQLLGRRTAELHLCLASGAEESVFAPEKFTTLYLRSLYQSMQNLTGQTFRQLKSRLKNFSSEERGDVQALLDRQSEIGKHFRSIIDLKNAGQRIRTHGDFHLGQVLFTGKDFFIMDFEGEPARAITERRIKRSPLRDVAGMLRSFDYAVHTGLNVLWATGGATAENRELIENLGDYWRCWVSSTFLRSYVEHAAESPLLPSAEEFPVLLKAYLLEKAVYELGYELNSRPEWVKIPLTGIQRLLGE